MRPDSFSMLLMLCVAGSALAAEPDLENGADINETCAACHGELGQGGKNGEYPRLAGLSPRYIAQQLRAFRERARINIPMVPYTEERELPDQDILDVSAYLGSLQLPNRMPEFKSTDDSLTRLQLAREVIQIARAEGNAENGATIYQKNCGGCHSQDGTGKGIYPALRGQYTQYLKRQLNEFIRGARLHEQDEPGPSLVTNFTEKQLQDILAHLSTLDD